MTKVNIQNVQEDVKLHFYNQEQHLVSLGLSWNQLHSYFYSLAEMSRLADWNLEDVFGWSGDNLHSSHSDS